MICALVVFSWTMDQELKAAELQPLSKFTLHSLYPLTVLRRDTMRGEAEESSGEIGGALHIRRLPLGRQRLFFPNTSVLFKNTLSTAQRYFRVPAIGRREEYVHFD